MRKAFFALLFLTVYGQALCQTQVKISGKILQSSNQKPVEGAYISVPQTGYATSSDSSGYYEISVQAGNYNFIITHQSFFKKYIPFEAKQSQVVDFTLDEKINNLEEVRISANSIQQNIKSLTTGVTTLTAKSLQKLPTLLGEVDIIRSLFTLPGVTTVGEGSSGFNVRGGNVDQNLILLDEAPIFNSSHLLGFFSVFNPDTFKDFNFYRGGISAQYGGRTSSVLNVNLKEATAAKPKIIGSIGSVASRLFIESPILSDKISFFAAGRISYVDQMINLFNIERLQDSRASFYDITSKLEVKASPNDRISVSFFHGLDNFKLAKDTTSALDNSTESLYNWQSTNATVAWSHYFNPKFSFKVFGIYSGYDVNITNDDSTTAFKINNGIDYRSVKGIGIYNVNEKQEIEVGFQINRYSVNPGTLEKTLPTSNKNPVSLRNEQGLESALFINDKITVSKNLELGLGMRYVRFQNMGENVVFNYQTGRPRNALTLVDSTVFGRGEAVKTYESLEPRLSLNWRLNGTSSIKASAHRMSQFINQISATTAALPSDTWKLSDTYIKPQRSDQYALGYFKNLEKKSIEISLEVFYKNLFHVIEYKGGQTLLLNPNLETAILQGDGYAYGSEFYLRKNLGVFTGWLSYTYSQARVKINGAFEEEIINNGQYFPPIFNRPHSFNAVASYQSTKTVTFSGNLNYTSGRAITYPASKFFLGGTTLPFYNSRNQSEIPDYLRLDVAMNVDTKANKTTGYRSSWNFSIYNLLGRRNAYSIFFRAKTPFNAFNSRVRIFKLSILGAIIPSIAYNFEF